MFRSRSRSRLELGRGLSLVAAAGLALALALCDLVGTGSAQLVLWRSVNVPGIASLPDLWTLNSSDLYETTFESLQWLVPTDLRRFDFISPGSTYQINRRFRNDAAVKRYYGYQLWKLHETRLSQRQLRVFIRRFGTL